MKAKALKPGDIIDVVAPASRCGAAELKAGIDFLRSIGLTPRVPKDIFGPKRPIFAQSDEVRLKHLKKALYAPDSKMVWCIRGGYGSLRLVPEMRQWKKPRQQKIFLGYSDITTLHAHLNQDWNWPTIHGPVLERAGSGRMGSKEKRIVLDLIFGREEKIEFHRLLPLNSQARRSRAINATVWGGNMAVLQSALGTPSALKPKGHILFFEDTGE